MPDFHIVFADWRSRPGRDENWREGRRSSFPTDELFRREYPETLDDVMLADEDMVFSAAAIAACTQEYPLPVPAVVGGVKHRYVKMWDEGRKNDAAVGICLDVTVAPYIIVDYQRWLRLPFPELQARIEGMHNAYPGVTYVGDDNTALAIVENLHVAASHFLSGASIKPKAISATKAALEDGYIVIPAQCKQLIGELRSYMWDDDGLVQDSVMTLSNALYVVGPPAYHFQRAAVSETAGRAAPLRPTAAAGGASRSISRLVPMTTGVSRRGRSSGNQPGQMARDYIR